MIRLVFRAALNLDREEALLPIRHQQFIGI
jgi:hypothetical protein